MAKEKEDKKIEVPESMLVKLQEDMARHELEMEELKNKNAGLEEMLSKGVDTTGEEKIKKSKNFEPKFRTVRIRKYPIAGDIDNLGYVIGWTNRGAYEEVDRNGVSPQVVNYLDLIFLGHEKGEDGKLKAEKVKHLDYLNKGIQVHCKIVDTDKKVREVPTGEQINVAVFDPQHGLVSTGEIIDGYVCYTDIKYKIQIPGVAEPVWIDSLYCN